jgi:hypothetical protein
MGAALVTSVSQAMDGMKALGDQSVFWDQTFVHESRQAVANVIHGRMQARVARHLEQCRQSGREDRRNGSYPRRIPTELGAMAVRVPRTYQYSPAVLLRRVGQAGR